MHKRPPTIVPALLGLLMAAAGTTMLSQPAHASDTRQLAAAAPSTPTPEPTATTSPTPGPKPPEPTATAVPTADPGPKPGGPQQTPTSAPEPGPTSYDGGVVGGSASSGDVVRASGPDLANGLGLVAVVAGLALAAFGVLRMLRSGFRRGSGA